MKNLKIIFILVSLNLNFLILAAPEIIISNASSVNKTITLKIYPVSMVFNGISHYNLLADKRSTNYGSKFYYINGTSISTNNLVLTKYSLSPYGLLKINHDNDPTANSGNHTTMGFGLYKVEVWWSGTYDTDPPDDYYTIEYDYGYRIQHPTNADLSIFFYDNNSDPRIEFKWVGNGLLRKTRDVGRKIECWNQYENGSRPKDFGNFQYNNGTFDTPNNNTILPQDPRRDCVPEIYPLYPAQNQIFNVIGQYDTQGPANIGILTIKPNY